MSSGYHVASVSWGKDSLRMLLALLEEGWPLEEVVFYDTEAEFRAIYDVRDRMLPEIERAGVKYTELRPNEPFFYTMLARPVHEPEPKPRERQSPMNRLFGDAGLLPESTHYGYGWCGGLCRWGTSAKTSALDKYASRVGATTIYVGLACDEQGRIAKNKDPRKKYPLDTMRYDEARCLRDCKASGFTWEEDGVPLYDVLDRVSCWCCRNKNLKELRAIHDCLPRYWERLMSLETMNGQMKQSGTLAEMAEQWESERDGLDAIR